MADFTSSFWNYWIVFFTVIGIAGCAWLVFTLSRKKVRKGEPVDTTGHVWDVDLQELDNPLPRWWMNMFYMLIGIAVLYLVLFPGLGAAKGLLGWTSTGEYKTELAKAEAVYGPIYKRFASMTVEETATHPEAVAIGQRLFLNNCAQCHGSDARGSLGFPNLVDADWQYGGDGESIKIGILEGRMGMMPPMVDAVGGPAGVTPVAHYVRSLSGAKHDAALAAAGQQLFAACAACHGEKGEGMHALGAPNLTDKTWLYGGSIATIEEAIIKGRMGVMPAWAKIIGEDKSHIVAAYVYSLGQTMQTSAAKTDASAATPQ